MLKGVVIYLVLGFLGTELLVPLPLQYRLWLFPFLEQGLVIIMCYHHR